MRSRFDNGHSCSKWDKLRLQTNFIMPNDKEGEFIRCPYCGDPLDKDMKCYIYVEMDTLHYSDKRLEGFVEKVLKNNYKITDQLKTDNFWILNLECKGDGDKISKDLTSGFREIKSAHDKRHDRWTLN